MRRLALAGLVCALFLMGAAPLAAGALSGGNTYVTYRVGINGGEPSIGFDKLRNVAMYGQTKVRRLKWDDSVTPGRMTATDVSPVTATSLDPITIVDPYTSRTFSSQLLAACSETYFSDDAGASWLPSQGCGVDTFLDHQSLGAGPFHAPLTGSVYPDAVYYCAQNGFNASCALSLDGGFSFNPGVYAYNTPANDVSDPNPTFAAEGGACSALHGHIRVGPDGTAYLPLKGCGGAPSAQNATNTEFVGGHPSLSVSEDNGFTWSVRMVNKADASNPDESDPSIGIGAKGTLYFGWENGTNPSDFKNTDHRQAKIAVSHDRGLTWTNPVDVSTPMGLRNVVFPEVIAGDDDRAAFAFLGTTALGDTQTNAFPNAPWYLYVSTTYDGGKTWSTVNATPNDPVQHGCVDMQGTTVSSRTDVCSQRNLLDFNDITVDNDGRALVAYADGCTGDCSTNPSAKTSGAVDTVTRQTTGVGLYAARTLPVTTETSVSGPGPGQPVTATTLQLPPTSPGLLAGLLVFLLLGAAATGAVLSSPGAAGSRRSRG